MAEIAVIGAGPIGSVVAAVLAAGEHRVHLREIAAVRRDQIAAHGISLRGARELHVAAGRLASLEPDIESLRDIACDAVFVCVKATATLLVASALADVLPGDTTVVSWQNGIDTERLLAGELPAARIVRAIVNHGVSLSGEMGEVTVSFEHPPHAVQELEAGSEQQATWVANLMTAAGLETERSEQLERMVWRKAILNAAVNALCGLTGLNMAEVTRDRAAWELAEHILVESTAVARANEIALGSGFYRWATDYLQRAGAHRPSMLLDLDAGRRTEIDVINGTIVEYGRRAGVPTPYNESVVSLVKAREAYLRSRQT